MESNTRGDRARWCCLDGCGVHAEHRYRRTVEVMPVYLMFGLGLAVITGWAIVGYVLLHGTRIHIYALFLFAWVVVFALWWWQL
jgi:hypothetical protein